MRQLDKKSQHAAKARCKRCTEHAELQRIDAYIVENDIRQRGDRHGSHGKMRVAIVAHKSGHDIIEDESRGEKQNYAQIGCGV